MRFWKMVSSRKLQIYEYNKLWFKFKPYWSYVTRVMTILVKLVKTGVNPIYGVFDDDNGLF